MSTPDRVIGVIGGSGLYEMEGLSQVERVRVETPFGVPSDEIVVGRLGDARLAFLPRHGHGHRLLPGEINYRANVHALKQLGAQWIVSVSAVGSLREEIRPGHLVVVDQYIDRTKGRPWTFFGDGCVGHVGFGDPVCAPLCDALEAAARDAGAVVHRGGTYVVMEGPQFSTRAESELHRQWGASVIGMTALPEAKLAREAELCYATLALATDYDCWHESEEDVTVEAVLGILRANVEMSRRVVRNVAARVPAARDCACATAVKHAILTEPAAIPPETRRRLELIVGKYV